ncbi:hypothetical protein RclHR1_05040013 [Rhizophagus clarus]|uniref:Ion transport domain-containing protein n=1 Tax=Rhizophagus clarus TaxID=94130 RepID=A0A2Z6S3L5_9GLOM|nr:hypothetical protein RclHR1_05040013 [Rhizophagus clarus]
MGEVSIEIDIDKTDIEKFDIEKSHKSHNGKTITGLFISPDEKYVVTYSKKDQSLAVWNVEDIEEGRLKLDSSFQTDKLDLDYTCITDDKKIIFSALGKEVKIIDMKNNQKITPPPNLSSTISSYSEFCLYKRDHFYYKHGAYIFIYSTKLKNNEFICKSIYRFPDDEEDDIEVEFGTFCTYFIKITKYDRIYVHRFDYVYVSNIYTGKSFRIHVKNGYDGGTDNEDFICIKSGENLIIYSIEFEAIIATVDYIEIYNFMKRTNLHSLLLPLITNSGVWNSLMDHYWKKFINRLKENNQLPKEYQTKSSPHFLKFTDEYIYGILDGYVWKYKLDFTDFSLDDLDSNSDDKVKAKTYDDLSVNLFNHHQHMITIYKIFQNELSSNVNESIKWDLDIAPGAIFLKVFKKIKVNDDWEWNYICERLIKHEYISPFMHRIISSSLFSNDDIVILTTMGFFICHCDIYNKSINLNYFYRMEELIGGNDDKVAKKLNYYRELFSKPTLPIPSSVSLKMNQDWIVELINDKLCLLKYGDKLLSYSIEIHKMEFVDKIYKNCLTYYKQDLSDSDCHLKFLKIIVNAMPLLNEYYPDYILRFSLDTNMTADFPGFYMKYRSISLHLHPFKRNPQLINLSRSINWYEYVRSIQKLRKNRIYLFKYIKYLIILLILPILPIYFALFYVLSNLRLINFIKYEGLFSYLYWYITRRSGLLKFFEMKQNKDQTVPKITFAIPFVGFINYPKDYDWRWELIKPKPSRFVEVINRDIYNTWNGESLINFKWNTYGKYYYIAIWIFFMSLFICFSAAASISLPENIRNQLLIISIILGLIHLSFEVRQLIFNPIKWVHNFWNFFGIYHSNYFKKRKDRYIN